jgi:O-antigen ligase
MIDTSITMTDRHYSEQKKSISVLNACFILAGTCIYFFYGQLLFPIWVLLLPPIAIGIGIISLLSESITFFIFAITAALIQLKPDHGGAFSTADAMAGAAITWVMISVILKKIFSPEQHIVGSKEYFIFMLYFVWIILVGISNLLFFHTPFAGWYRDILLFTPLVLIPPLFSNIDLKKKSDKTIFYGTMLILCIIYFIASVVRVRSSFLTSTYLFEVSYGALNIIIGPCMTFVFFNLLLTEKKGKERYFFFIGIIISMLIIFLTHNRTMWVLTPVGIVFTLFFIRKEEWKKFYKLVLYLLSFFVSLVGILYLAFPFVRTLVRFFLSYILTSSNFRTDISLLGRYIEWRYVIESIKDSPIVGHGIGNGYRLYNWFGGYFISSSYTHNAYLGALLKGGIVGFILLFAAYIGFIWKGIRLLNTRVLSGVERGLIRAGISTLLILLIADGTFNMFGHRDVMLYVGITWGYFIYIDRSSSPKPILNKSLADLN